MVQDLLDNVVTEVVRSSNHVSAERHKRRGNEYYKRRRFDKAQREYDLAHQLEPNNPVFLVNKAVTLYVVNDFIGCRKACEKAIVLAREQNSNPQWTGKALATIAAVENKEGNFVDAIRMYRLSLVEYPDDKVQKRLDDLLAEQSHQNHLLSESQQASGMQDKRAQLDGRPKRGQDHNLDARARLADELVRLEANAFTVFQELCKFASSTKVKVCHYFYSFFYQINFLFFGYAC